MSPHLLVLVGLLALLEGRTAPATAGVPAPDPTASWQSASLIPINHFAHPRRKGQTAVTGKAHVPDVQVTPAPREPETEPDRAATGPALETPTDDWSGALPEELSEDVVRPMVAAGAFWPLAPLGASISRAAPTLALALWQGHWGVAADTVVFGDTNASGFAAPVFHADTLLSDVQVRWRGAGPGPGSATQPGYEIGVGYRGLGLGDVNFGAVSAAVSLPLGSRALLLEGKASAGYAPTGVTCLDGSLALATRARALRASVGVRRLAIGGSPSAFNIWGPQVDLALVF